MNGNSVFFFSGFILAPLCNAQIPRLRWSALQTRTRSYQRAAHVCHCTRATWTFWGTLISQHRWVIRPHDRIFSFVYSTAEQCHGMAHKQSSIWNAILYHIVLHETMSYHIVSHHIEANRCIQCDSIPFVTMPYYDEIIPYTMWCNIIQYHTIQYDTIPLLPFLTVI